MSDWHKVRTLIMQKLGGDGVLERIFLPIVKYIKVIQRQKPSEVESTENERKYSISGALTKGLDGQIS